MTQAEPEHVDFAEDDGCFCYDEDRDEIGHTPDPESIFDVLTEAAECQDNFHPEATCNMTPNCIDYPRPPSGRTPIEECRLLRRIYLEPTADLSLHCMDSTSFLSVKSAITTARNRLPHGVINHTTYHPLRERPIALSIETMKTGEGWEEVTLQMGVWQAAQ
ncbi:hypothetical protein B0J13DRAFT_627725 [Dactylonectria estremocensis]|uniref:PD-(D/E)XK nuclease-like domain-containing protein n=1 Tax=Dactylonectria estremocensis TaxID=1079267 RepID=A0A9P9DZL0_9HYPO|nr:hypothetical protein B0J13DRAFT_627725 [Dactylonectria estremocensis]